MRTKIAVLVWLAAMISGNATQQVDRDKLRQAAKFPQVSLMLGLGFSTTRGFIMFGVKPDVPTEIAALQKEIKGDASDAERYYRLGQLYREMKEEDRAKEAFAMAVDLYRPQVPAQPHDGRLLAQFGEALSVADQKGEAETVLRQAVKVAPQEWRCWVALGQFLQDRLPSVLLGVNVTAEDIADYGKLLAQISQNKPSPERIAQAQRLLDEARDCFDRAVAAAPQEPQTYAARGSVRAWGLGPYLLRGLRGEGANPGAMFPPESLSDFQQAARLSPNDSRAVALAALFEIMSFAAHSGQQLDFGKGEVWNALPEPSKQSVQGAMSQLEKLAQSQDIHVAADASEALGMLQFFAGDSTGAETSLRRALTLDPSREQAWDMLTSLTAEAKRYEDLVSLCEERLKRKDIARTRLLLAYTYEKLNRLDQAEEQVQAALKLEPEDFTANLALAVLLLKRSDDVAVLSRAGELLNKAGEIIRESPTPVQWMDYSTTGGIYLALRGSLEEARQQLKRVLEYDLHNEAAREALEALGG